MADDLWAGRYRRDRLLGRGAMGEVWAARDVVLDRQVAIKSISASRTDPEDQQRMAREARVAARIAHPNAVAVHDLVTVDERPNLVMEYVDGDTLADRIRRDGRLDPRQVAAIGAAVADALAEAHRLGVVHRDIKPANILITPRGVPKLADFGIARVAGDANMTATGMMIGTPAYLAPEIVGGGNADARSDIWSLGVTLYAALEGSPPFVVRPDDEPFVVLGRVMHAPIRPPSCGGTLARAVGAMLDRDPSRRPDAEQVAALLRGTGASVAPHDTTVRQHRDPTPPVGGWADGGPAYAATAVQSIPPHRPGRPPAQPPAPHPVQQGGGRTEPLLPGVWTTGEHDPPPPPRRGSGRTIAVVAAAVVVIVAAGVAAFLLVSRNRSSPSADRSNTVAARPPSTAPRTAVSRTSASQTGGSATTSSSSGVPTPGAGQSEYSAPGGITVIAPSGWSRSSEAGNNNVIGYNAPGSTGFVHGLAMQLGIGNPHSLPTIQDEADGAKTYLRSVETDLTFVQTTYATYLGSPGVTLEYTGVNGEGVQRHGIERLWVTAGVTRELIVSGRADQWSQTLPVFEQLVGSARVG